MRTLLSLAFLALATSQALAQCGDCDGNGVVDVLDSLAAVQHAVAIINLVTPAFEACNVVGTLGGPMTPGAVVDVLDALLIAQFAAGIGTLQSCGIRSAVSLVALGPGSLLGIGPNQVGGGPTLFDPCDYDLPFTFSLGGPNMGELTRQVEFRDGGNPLVFDRDGQSAQIIVQLSTAGTGVPLTDVSVAATADGTTTYSLAPGFGGPYTSIDANGLVTSLQVGAMGSSGCDVVSVTFTPNGLGLSGGSSGPPLLAEFAACIDYYGWDSYSRDTLGMLAPGDFDAHMPGTPSGVAPPRAGAEVQILVVAAARPADAPEQFDMQLHYDNTILEAPLPGSHTRTCPAPLTGPPWTMISSPSQPWRLNGFRVGAQTFASAGIQHEGLYELTLAHISSGSMIMRFETREWATSTPTLARIPGTYPLPVFSPGCSAGFTVP